MHNAVSLSLRGSMWTNSWLRPISFSLCRRWRKPKIHFEFKQLEFRTFFFFYFFLSFLVWLSFSCNHFLLSLSLFYFYLVLVLFLVFSFALTLHLIIRRSVLVRARQIWRLNTNRIQGVISHLLWHRVKEFNVLPASFLHHKFFGKMFTIIKQ